MPTYRVYYGEIETRDSSGVGVAGRLAYPAASEYTTLTEWEDEVEADDPVGALDAFFREHAPDRSRLAWVDEDGVAHPLQGFDFDPDATYIWTETPENESDNPRLLEYQGIDEATPGKVTCPLCNGHGEVDEELAAEFDEAWGNDEEEDSF